MSIHGDVYYEDKENETTMKDRKPGDLSNDLKEALGMPPVCFCVVNDYVIFFFFLHIPPTLFSLATCCIRF